MAVIITPGNANPSDVRVNKRFNAGANYNTAGTMNEVGAINKSLAINETYIIPEGHTDGGQVTQSIPVKTAATITPSQSVQTIASGQYLGGAQTISAVSFDAAKVLNDTTIAGKTGTMPKRVGDTEALALSVSGTTLKLRASDGYRDGVNDNVTHTDANRIAANIKKDVMLDGITGTLEPLPTNVSAGDILIASDPSIVSNAVNYMAKVKEMKMLRAGSVRVTFTMYSNINTLPGWGQIYINGVATGVNG